MKIDRRSFLSFTIGGAVGTTLSPLPWKLTDDMSIWSQNWPWTPVAAQGEVSHVTSTCTLCPAGCGISVRKVENRVVKIDGLKGHPINDGGICMLGLTGLQRLYGPSRIQTPLKRKGERGAGKWERISWEQAIAELAEKLAAMRTTGESHKLACIADAGHGTIPNLLERFLSAYGSPNFIQTASIMDAYEMALYRMTGMNGPVGFDIENTDFLLSFGAGVIEGWVSPVRMIRANSQRLDNDGKLVQIDTRLSNTAAKADHWVPIKPGSEAVLAMGVASVIVTEELYDQALVKAHAESFMTFKSMLEKSFNIDAVSEATAVDKSTIINLARDFAKAGSPLAISGRGKGTTPGSLGEAMAVQTLNALAGNINRPGGVWTVPMPDYINWPDPQMDTTAASGVENPRIDGAGTQKYPHTKHLLNRLAGENDSEETSPIQMLMVSGANPCYSLPDSSLVRQAINKIPDVVSFSSYMDETTQMADYILPNHTYLERFEDVPAPSGYPRPFVGLVAPAVAPQLNTMHTGDVILALARKLGGTIAASFPWKNYENCLMTTLGDNWDAMLEQGYWTDADFKAPDLKTVISEGSGKFMFPNPGIGIGVVAIGGDEKTYPLVLIPYDSLRLSSTNAPNTPFMTKTLADTILKGNDVFVEVNPKTAKSMGLAEGRKAELKTPKGAGRVKIHISERVGPGLVALPTGLGHNLDDKYLSGKGINYNELAGSVEDPTSGFDAAWGVRATLKLL